MANSSRPSQIGIKLGTARRPRGQTKAGIEAAQQLMTQMLPQGVVIRRLMDRFSVSEQTAKKYVESACAVLGETPPLDLHVRRTLMRDALGVHYVECMANSAYGSAGRALELMIKMDGLMPDPRAPAPRQEGSAAAGSIPDTDPERVRARMAELLERHQATIDALKNKKG